MIASRRELFKLIGAAAVIAVIPAALVPAVPAVVSTWLKHFNERMAHTILVGYQTNKADIEAHACFAASQQMLAALRDEDVDILGRVRRDAVCNVHQLELLKSREKLEALDCGIVDLMAAYVPDVDVKYSDFADWFSNGRML